MLSTAFTTFIRPVLEYACQVWHFNIPGNLSDDTERVQRRALRIILPELSYNDARELNIPSLKERREILCEQFFLRDENLQKLDEFLPNKSSSASTSFPGQGAIIRVPTYRRYAKFMVWYFFVFSQVPRRYAEIYYSCTYIFLLAITCKPAKVFKTVKNFSCTCKFHASDIFWDEKSQKVIFVLDQKNYRHRPTEKKSLG
jgi:hypothetical protein